MCIFFNPEKTKPPQRHETLAAALWERLHETLDSECLHILFHSRDAANAEVAY